MMRLRWFAAAVLPLLLSSAALSDEINPDLIRRVELKWGADERATEYELELSMQSDFSENLYSLKTPDTHYAVDLLPGAYFYRVRAVDKGGRPGRWTQVQELNINARPPALVSPPDQETYAGNLPDGGVELEWRSSGPGVRYLVEVRGPSGDGSAKKVLVKQEVDGTSYSFYPSEPGRFEWSVHTLGAGGDEPGETRGFTVAGAAEGEGEGGSRLRYVSPWWRGHWTIYARYGQSTQSYSIVDQDLRATGAFGGFAGYLGATLNWEWHEGVGWLARGIPWLEGELEIHRQTVFGEGVVLPRWSVRAGSWWQAGDWRLGPLLEFTRRTIAFYQPLSGTEATRANSEPSSIAFGLGLEWSLEPFLKVGVMGKTLWGFGGRGGMYPIGGVFDPEIRAGDLNPSRNFEGILSATLLLNSRMQVLGRLRMGTADQSWLGEFEPPTPGAASSVTILDLGFDVAFGLRF